MFQIAVLLTIAKQLSVSTRIIAMEQLPNLNDMTWRISILHQKNKERKKWLQKKQLCDQGRARKIRKKLEYLKTEKRQEVVERIREAREFGDLSENAEYEAAKDEQAFIETDIAAVEETLRSAVIIENMPKNADIVEIGRTVAFFELPEGEEESYTIVGKVEADPLEGKMSNDSPIARSLIGCKVGDQVTVPTPGGDVDVKILKMN